MHPYTHYACAETDVRDWILSSVEHDTKPY